MWELDYKESWAPKNWCFSTVVLEKTLESPLDCKEIQPVYPKGNQSWIFIGRTDAEAKTPILWTPDAKSQLIGKDPDARKDWKREEKGTSEDEMVRWHHQHNGLEFGLALGVADGQGSLAYCSPWGWKELEMSERLNRTEYTTVLKSNYIFSISNLRKYIPKHMTENKLDAFTNSFSSVWSLGSIWWKGQMEEGIAKLRYWFNQDRVSKM